MLLYILAAIFGPIFYVGKFPLATYQLVFAGLFFVAALGAISNRRTTIIVPGVMKLYLLLLFFYAFSAMTNLWELDYHAHPRDAVVVFAPLQYFVLVCLVATFVARSNIDYGRLAKGYMVANALVLALVGLISVLQMLDLFNAQSILAEYYGKTNVETWREYFQYNPRASATFNLEPNTLGLFCSIAMLNLQMFARESGLPLVVSAMCYVLGLVALILSGSFTGLVVLFLVTFIYLFVYRRIGFKTTAVISVVLFSTYFTFQPEISASLARQKLSSEQIIPSSIKARMDNAWTKAGVAIANEPVNGIGAGVGVLDYSADNDYLDKFLRFGVLGGSAFVLWVASLIAIPLVLRTRTRAVLPRKLFLFSSLIALALALASVTGSAFNAPRLAEYFWMFYILPFMLLRSALKTVQATKVVNSNPMPTVAGIAASRNASDPL